MHVFKIGGLAVTILYVRDTQVNFNKNLNKVEIVKRPFTKSFPKDYSVSIAILRTVISSGRVGML